MIMNVKIIQTTGLHKGVRKMTKNEHTLTLSTKHIKNELKEEYITIIIKLLRLCNDISLLDLIKKLLEKSI